MGMFGTLGKQAPVAAFKDDPMQMAVKSPVAPAPIAPMPGVQPKKEGFYGDMPMWKVLLGTALDNIAQQTGGQGVFTQGVRMQQMQRQRAASEKAQREADMRDWLAKQQYEFTHRQPQILNTGDGGIARVTPDGSIEMLRQPDPPQKGETERLIDTWAAMPDSDPRKAVLRQAIRGAGYDPTVYQPKLDYETASRLRVKTTAPGKNPSSGRGRAAPKPPAGFILD